MFKKNIKFALMLLAVLTIKDLFFAEKIQWGENFIFFAVTFLLYSLWDWSNTPYDWNKNKSNDIR
ncbi:hypothetical protein [Halalkalibacter sp. APA_J-10(15)]|uniref:hypothetical protein n=1 Tax=Halalkalibacter sp. APA_J-10(15) TaxID=2933805 RepID=UPI001FF3365B|nr:hypothetical protein [Halalkalibacter sp. APA_J-10(15)]MCK0473181.1 hypothetical protein [Halalkalibacter sp. APA_J-10(15)]